MVAVMPRTSSRRNAGVPARAEQNPVEFEQQAKAVLERLQAAMARLIESIPAAGHIDRPTDLQRTLGIHSKLAWQVFRVATADNPIQEGRSVPGGTSMERFLTAAANRGVPNARLDDVRRAFQGFEELVNVHAGNRPAFESMIGGLAEVSSDQLDLTHRRAAFRAFAHFLGARAKAMLGCSIYQPSAQNPGMLESINLKGLFGLSTQRPDAAWELSSLKGAQEVESIRPSRAGDKQDAGADIEGIALFKEFCSWPLPPLKTVQREEGRVSVLVHGQLIDNMSALNLVLGPMKLDGIARYRTADNNVLLTSVAVRTPSEVLIHDVLVHKGVFPHASPRVELFHTLAGGPFGRFQPEHDRLQMRESVIYLGGGADVVETPEIPDYPEMVRTACARAGWDPAAFDVYRCRMEFPVVPSTVRVMFDLPEKPSS